MNDEYDEKFDFCVKFHEAKTKMTYCCQRH